MVSFQNVVVTEIMPPFTVFSKKDRTFTMTSRPSYGISFCLGGQITYIHNEKKYISKPNSIVLLPKGATYSLHGDNEGLFPLVNFQCENLDIDSFLVLDIKNQTELLNEYERIGNHLLRGNRLMAFASFYKLLSVLVTEQNIKNPLFYFAENYIKNNISDLTLSNDKVAKATGISEVYLRKLFLKYHSATPKQYIIELRLQNAKQLLTNTQYTVTEISEKSGFSSVYNFCRIFKNKVGFTPSDYAKQKRIFKI